jgi:hypothetical protein
VNVTFVPAQIVVALATILTEGDTLDVTVIVMAFDVTAACVTQDSDEIISTVTTSLLASVAF